MTWIFGSFLVIPRALTSCRVVICKQWGWQCVGAGRSSRCVTGRITIRSDLDRNKESGVEPGTRSRSEALGRLRRYGLQGGTSVGTHLQAPRRRYGTRRSRIFEYMSLHLSLKLTTNCRPLSRIKWEIYFYKEVFRSFIEFRKLCTRL